LPTARISTSVPLNHLKAFSGGGNDRLKAEEKRLPYVSFFMTADNNVPSRILGGKEVHEPLDLYWNQFSYLIKIN